MIYIDSSALTAECAAFIAEIAAESRDYCQHISRLFGQQNTLMTAPPCVN